MLLLIVLSLLDFGSSFYTKAVCYGTSYDVPIYYTPPLYTVVIYYKQKGQGRTLAVNKEGESKHKRFVVGLGSIKIKDMTEQDDGATLFFGQEDSIELKIQDCQNPTSTNYGSLFSWKVPNGAEYLEFSQITPSGLALRPQVIWNRTDASSGRGTVKRNYFELYNLKQKDSGYYKFMGADGQLIGWKRLEVNEYDRHFEHMEGDLFIMDFPVKLSPFRVLFTPQGRTYEIHYTNSKMELNEYILTFRDLKREDAGTYKFIDNEGFLALRLKLEVKIAQLPYWVYVVALIIIGLFITICCCCVKKRCCKKTSSKRTNPQNQTTAPPVFYHNDTTHPTQPLIALPSPTSTQVTAPVGQGPKNMPVMSTSIDADPKFEFKGTVFPSASPLSSGTSIQDVYTSDKLNFL